MESECTVYKYLNIVCYVSYICWESVFGSARPDMPQILKKCKKILSKTKITPASDLSITTTAVGTTSSGNALKPVTSLNQYIIPQRFLRIKK